MQVVCGAPNARAGMLGVFGAPGAYVPGSGITLALEPVNVRVDHPGSLLDRTAEGVYVAKGVDSLALKIREVATKHSIPIVENPPLARALYRHAIEARYRFFSYGDAMLLDRLR